MRRPEPLREPASLERRDRPRSRRGFLAGVAAGFVGGVAGCLKPPSFPDADVVAAPDDRFVFEPAELTVSVGESVRWGFASPGHNVSCRPGDAEEVVTPDGAEPFSSYGPDQDPEVTLVPRGETYEHTFEVPGRYTYVCIPHADAGMTGTVLVE